MSLENRTPEKNKKKPPVAPKRGGDDLTRVFS